jgi:hypothetical protein
MSCWKLVQFVLGSTIEDNLELFAAIWLQNARKLIQEESEDDRIVKHFPLNQRSKKPWDKDHGYTYLGI